MTTLYKPVLIESAEQAEALAEGTFAFSEFDFVRERCHGGWTGGDGETLYSHTDMTGYAALVPIEAEEEETEEIQVYRGVAHIGPRAVTPAPSRRFVTPWEEAQ